MQALNKTEQNILASAFKGLKPEELSALYSLSKIRKLKVDEVLIHENDVDQTIYVILEGEIKIIKSIQDRIVEIATLLKGSWVGEIAFSRRIPRTASAIATKPTVVMSIDNNTLKGLSEKIQLFFYKRMNDLAAERIVDLMNIEKQVNDLNGQMKEYLFAFKKRQEVNFESSEIILGIVRKVPKLPVFASNLAIKLLEDKLSPKEVAEIVKEDPSLLALVIKTVNSPFYGFSKKISDINHAITLMGFNQLYQLIVSEGVKRTLPDNKEFRELHSHLVSISHIAFAISLDSQIDKPSQMATIGLLHDLGHTVIHLLKLQNPKMAFLINSIDPAQLGGLLLKEWNIPQDIWEVVKYQSYPEFTSSANIPDHLLEKVAILYLSHLCLELFNSSKNKGMNTIFMDDYTKILGWKGLTLEEIVQKRVLPNMIKTMDALPSFLRQLLKQYIQSCQK